MPKAAEPAVWRAAPGARMATPACRIAQFLATLTGWRRYGAAFLLGVVLAGALPPVDLTPLIFVSFPGLLWLDDGSNRPGASFRLGYVFALGFFVAGLYWIAAALFVDLADFWWLLPFAVLGIPAGLALLPAAALALLRAAASRFGLGAAGRICAFAALWSAAEWVRGHALTGLPWNLVGYVWAGGFPGAITVLQSTAWWGIYGLSLVTVLAASLPAWFGQPVFRPTGRVRRFAPAAAAALLLLIPAGAGALRLEQRPTAFGDTWLRLVQPSISETLKWNPAAAESNFRRLTELSAAPKTHALSAIVWPEAAATFFLDRDAAHRQAIAAVAPAGGYVLTGALREEPAAGPVERVFNSLEAVDASGAIRAVYDKAHLVPFGEYVPLRSVLPINKLTPGSIDLSPGPGPATIALPGLPAFSPLICYEAIFPGAVVDPQRRPAWLLNVTNDAWYGRSSGPYQHFAIARTRAVEEGLPLVRAGNNGISGVIDPEGRVLARTALDAVGYADVVLPLPADATPYARAHDAIFAVMLLIVLVPAYLDRRRWPGE
jgi:apolipoprotein N-acyltransferase